MKFRKIMALAMAATMSMAVLVGCGSSSTSTSGTAKNKKLVIGFSQIGAESGWRTAETNSVKDIPKNNADVDVKFSDAQGKQENQIAAIRTFIAQKVDVIALAPVVESGWDTVLKEAKDAKIPVVLLDRMVKVNDDSLYSTFIGSDFIQEGKTAAKWLTDNMKDAKVNIVELQGTVGASAATDRKKGFEAGIKDFANMKITKSQSGDFTRAKGKEVMEAFLKADGKNIQVVYAHNDDMALGAIQAIEEYGLKPGTDIKVVSIDGIKDAFQAVADGKSNYVVECNPLLGPQLLKAAKDLKDGKTLEKWIKSDESAFDQAGAKKELPNRQY